MNTYEDRIRKIMDENIDDPSFDYFSAVAAVESENTVFTITHEYEGCIFTFTTPNRDEAVDRVDTLAAEGIKFTYDIPGY